MYSNHNLRTNLQEWKSRISKSTFDQFANQLQYFKQRIEESMALQGLLSEASAKYPYTHEEIDEIHGALQNGSEIRFENEIQHASFCLAFFNYIQTEIKGYHFHQITTFQGHSYLDTKENVIDRLVSPIVYYLHDRLDQASATIYLLERYKRRTEWFTKYDLYDKYCQHPSVSEKVLEDNLRLFLFDQGIDYPFSTPSSASGRADIIGAIDTKDPIVVEIKIFDREKSYGKNRIKDGFTQIVKYANDYGKDVGYLVIFNADKAELNFKLPGGDHLFPPKLHFNNKTFYFIVINILPQTAASIIGKIEAIEITETDLL
jgi:hypothetical protein